MDQVVFDIVETSQEIPKEIKWNEINEEVAEQGYIKVTIQNFSGLRDTRKHYFNPFELAGKQWRLLLFPMGNNCDSISLYLDFVGPRVGKWATCAEFVIGLIGEEDQFYQKEAHHRFFEEDIDWGFNNYISKNIFYNEEKGKRFVVDDTVTFIIAIRVFQDPTGVLWHNFVNYDSKVETGYVGLKNQGATCYMNSILQSLYFTNSLRRAVFSMPTEDDDPVKSIPLALQRVFYHLQYNNKPVGTTELTKSFGWETIDSFMQHDVQEFNRVLCDKLETKMKGTPVEGVITKLLEGKMKSYVKCTNVNYESSREESFYDIQLNVKGLKNLEQSFEDYIQVETLDGDNKYHADKYGLQEAKKGVTFIKYPPVLHLQLKRFEYDIQKDAMVKINDRYEFPESIDLTRFLESPDPEDPQIYHLHGVLVHSGDLHGGHYCAFIKPEEDDKWFKFDDDRVTRCLKRDAMDENFGTNPEEKKEFSMKPTSRFSKKFTNAYMLVYIRESDLSDVLCPVDQSSIPNLTRQRFIKEQEMEEKRRKDKEEQHLYTPVRLVTSQIAKNHHGTDLSLFDAKSEGPTVALNMKVKKDLSFQEFRVLLAEQLGLPIERQRIWGMAKRQNGTIRVDECLSRFNKETMQQIKDILKISELRFFLEESNVDPMEEDTTEYFKKFDPNEDILIFVKSYDPARSLLQYEGHYILKRTQTLMDLIVTINTQLGRPASHPLKLYEEVRPTMIDPIKPDQTFQDHEISTGDIVVYQDLPTDKGQNDFEFPKAPQYYEHLQNSIVVNFRSRNQPKDTDSQFTLQLSKKMKYDVVAKKVGETIGITPDKIRFVSHGHYIDAPKQEFKYNPETTLEEMLQPSQYQPLVDILYYEKLEIPITEMETKRILSVTWINKMGKEKVYKLLIDKNGTIEDLYDVLKQKIEADADVDMVDIKEKKDEEMDKDMKDVKEDTSVSSEKKDDDQIKEMDKDMKDVTVDSTEDVKGSKEENENEDEETQEMEKDSKPGKFRLLEVYNSRIFKTFSRTDFIKSINDYSPLIAEEIPEDQLKIQEGDQLVSVFHYHKEAHSSFGTPFFFLLKKGEKFTDTLKRLQQKLRVSDEEFKKYKVTHVSYLRPKEIPDDAVLASERFATGDYLGLNHPDKNHKTTKSSYERAIIIKN